MRNSTNTINITYRELTQLVKEGKSITSLDPSSFAVGLAVKHGLNPNTVCRYRRKFIAERLYRTLVDNQEAQFSQVLNKLNEG